MNKKALYHNLAIVLLLLMILSSIFLSMLWRSNPENQFLYGGWITTCSGSLIILGGFLLLFSNATKDRFIKESFLREVMSKKEKAGRIFQPRAYAFGAFLFIMGLLFLLVYIALHN